MPKWLQLASNEYLGSRPDTVTLAKAHPDAGDHPTVDVLHLIPPCYFDDRNQHLECIACSARPLKQVASASDQEK
ncbi:hypothetical protein TGRH88_047410 [Toxoplasma gondii]|uniref:Uncharacterized protein n=1 Tax=Toxoplasma gondii TaxID=5811 RepID=A0A7J6K063_TOXGO|nr:hypothetical protein TGRH88_047410 [Toxoplasma gondii]